MADPNASNLQGEASDDGWKRLKRLFDYALAKHTPGEELPPVPEELREWAQDTTMATFAGMFMGGGHQWLQERRAGPFQPPAGLPTKAHVARAIAEAQTQRMARISNGTLKGGLRVGGLAAVFYAVQTLSGIYRARRDFHNTAYGGMAAGALLGLSLGGSSAARLRGTVLGAALGASVGVPAGLLQDKVIEWMPEEAQRRRAERFRHTEEILAGTVKPDRPEAPLRDYDIASAVIAQLEASLSSSPTQQAQQQQQQQEQEGGHQGGAEQQQQQQGSRRWWRLWR